MSDDLLLRALAGDREAQRAVRQRQAERRERRLATDKQAASAVPAPLPPTASSQAQRARHTHTVPSGAMERDELVTGALRGAATWLTTPRGLKELKARPSGSACRASAAAPPDANGTLKTCGRTSPACHAGTVPSAAPDPPAQPPPALAALLPAQHGLDTTNYESLGQDRMALLGALDSRFKKESDLEAQVQSLDDSIQDRAAQVAALKEALAAAQRSCEGAQQGQRPVSEARTHAAVR